jgi:hypothetical protein
MEKNLDKKLVELCIKYEIPESLLREAILLEKEKVILQNRRLAPRLVEMIERYTAQSIDNDS